VTGSDAQRLQAHVAALEGPRHRGSGAAALEQAADYIATQLRAAGFDPERRAFAFRGERHLNLLASLPGLDARHPRVLVGAHYDTVPGTPGADDNASGVTVMLEVARRLAGQRPEATVEFAAFTLEEPQGGVAYGVGSQAFVAEARSNGVRYAGALILEMVGYTDSRPGSQQLPAALFWKEVPRAGTFLAAIGDGRSARLLRAFAAASRAAVPGLDLVTFRTPFRGWLVPHTRLSDNRSFWDAGYPALMITDTAFLRNPHYHQASDRLSSLDFGFMARVAEAVEAAVRSLALFR
jgi:Zn-dependent M28 family amino/carboxypeptidase